MNLVDFQNVKISGTYNQYWWLYSIL